MFEVIMSFEPGFTCALLSFMLILSDISLFGIVSLKGRPLLIGFYMLL